MSIPEEKKEPKYFLYCHLFNDSEKGVIQSVKFEIIPEVKTILDFKGKLSKHLETTFKSQNIKYIPLNVCKTLDSPSLNDTSKIRMYFENLEDIYIKVSTEVIPIQTTNVDVNKDIVLSYKTLTKYSFYESSQKYVRVLIPVPGIEKVEPMTHALDDFEFELREDVAEESIPIEELLQNCKDSTGREVQVPKVVG